MSYIGLHIECDSEQGEILIAELSLLPFDTFEEKETGISAYCLKDQFNKAECINILAKYSISEDQLKIEEIAEQNWNEEWEKNFDPIRIGDKIYIRAPFHAPQQGIMYEVLINPKMAFGTGHHQTTYLMAQEMAEMDISGKSVFDVGTGTGILAVLASIMGALEVVASDIDDWSIDNSKENFVLNDVRVDVFQGAISELQLGKTFEILLANINKNVLLNEISDYFKHLGKGGHLILSGFYVTDTKDLINRAEEIGFTYLKTSNKEDWALLVLKK